MSVCLRGGRDAEQIKGTVLCSGGGGEDGVEAIAPEADDIAGERGEIAKQGAPSTCRVGLLGCRRVAVGIGVYCQPMLQISAQT